MNKKIASSILEWSKESPQELSLKITQLINAGADMIHYDIMDGKFVSNTTPFNESIIEIASNATPHFKDFHLMVDDPEKYMNKYKSIASSMTFHFETVSYRNAYSLIKDFRSNKTQISIAINPKTNVEQIYEYLGLIDMVLVMSVIPGKGGQSFIPETLEKIRKIRKYISLRGLKTLIQVDGGIKIHNAKEVFEAGADVIVSGSYITSSSDFKESINSLKEK